MELLTDAQRREHSIPKGMDLLVTPEDFKRDVSIPSPGIIDHG